MTTGNWQRRSLRRITSLGVGVILSTAGLVALSTAAFAHTNVVTGTAVLCATAWIWLLHRLVSGE